jgi:hypothetical protein
MNEKTDHRGFFKFIAKLHDIFGEYSLEELKHFKRMSRTQFPHIQSFLSDLIEIASEFKGVPPSKPRKPVKKREGAIPKLDWTSIEGLLSSREVFPTNQSLMEFANEIFDLDIKWKSPSRKNLVNRIVNLVRRQPLEGQLKSARLLRERAKGTSSKPLDEFFSQWERVIKKRERK